MFLRGKQHGTYSMSFVVDQRRGRLGRGHGGWDMAARKWTDGECERQGGLAVQKKCVRFAGGETGVRGLRVRTGRAGGSSRACESGEWREVRRKERWSSV